MFDKFESWRNFKEITRFGVRMKEEYKCLCHIGKDESTGEWVAFQSNHLVWPPVEVARGRKFVQPIASLIGLELA